MHRSRNTRLLVKEVSLAYEIDFFRAGDGNGDAIVVRYAPAPGENFYIHVTDGGFTGTGDLLVQHIRKFYGQNAIIGNVVLSHADNDHAAGLITLLEECDVRHLWMNRPWLYVDEVIDKFHGSYTREGLIKAMRDRHPFLVTLEEIAQRKGIPISSPLQGSNIGQFKVLAPSRARYVELIPDFEKTPQSYADKAAATLVEAIRAVVAKVKEALDIETLSENPPEVSASNESSVIQYGDLYGEKILLTADVGPKGLAEAADYAQSIGLSLTPNLIQIPHHGSRRNITPTILNRWLGGYPAAGRGEAVACVGKEKTDFPRKRVTNAFIRRGYNVTTTRNLSGDWVCFKHGYPSRPGTSTVPYEVFSDEVDET